MQKLLTLRKTGIIIKLQNAFNNYSSRKDTNYEKNLYGDHGCFGILHCGVLMQFDLQK